MPESLPRLLLEITDTLFLPCVGALIGLCLLSVLQVGGVMVEAIDRWRFGGPWRVLIDRLKREPGERAVADSLPVAFGFPELARRELQRTPHAREKVLDDLQLRAERLLGRLTLGIRLGPMLGLAGTLIPLGPALMSLSGGEIDRLAAQLVVAFATTVIGLQVGATCYFLHAVKRHWYTQDLNDIEYVAGRTGDPDA